MRKNKGKPRFEPRMPVRIAYACTGFPRSHGRAVAVTTARGRLGSK